MLVGIVKEYLKDFKSLEEYKIAYKMTPIHYQKFRVAIDEIISIYHLSWMLLQEAPLVKALPFSPGVTRQ